MNELNALESLGLTLPSSAYIAGSILFGLIGYVAYRRGKKMGNPLLTWSGVGLMVYPYAISETWLLWGLGLALCGWLYAMWE